MVLDKIPLYTIIPEVPESVADILLDASDSAEFLGADGYGLQSIYDICGTEYDDIFSAFVSCRAGEDWGMSGTLYRFRLTEELKAHIRKQGLTCIFGDDDRIFLENLSLFNGDKRVFSCLSHEVFCLSETSDISDEYADKIISSVNSVIRNVPLYAEMNEINRRLSNKSDKLVKKETDILFDLHCYVDRAKDYWFCRVPQYKCSFKRYRKIAEDYLTAKSLAVLNSVNGFAELQPLPVPHTADEAIAGVGNGATQYLQSDFYRQINQELCVLLYIRSNDKRISA